jgi:hypothetical protein
MENSNDVSLPRKRPLQTYHPHSAGISILKHGRSRRLHSVIDDPDLQRVYRYLDFFGSAPNHIKQY